MEDGEYSPLAEESKPKTFTSPMILKNQRKEKNKNSRRFSDEQIESLESIFKLETKLEPRKKLQVARELGLQPRQVAIWFQNRRARWKTKQIEKEYRVLKANYDNLKSQFQFLKDEKQSLLIQLKKLNDLLENPDDLDRESKGINITKDDWDNGNLNYELSWLNEKLNNGVSAYEDDNERGDNGYSRQEEESEQLNFRQENEPERLNLGEQVDSSLEQLERCCNNESSGLFNQSSGTSNWWDFWT